MDISEERLNQIVDDNERSVSNARKKLDDTRARLNGEANTSAQFALLAGFLQRFVSRREEIRDENNLKSF